MLFVGIDMSLKSPGVAVRRDGDTMTHLLGFQNREREAHRITNYLIQENKLTINRFPYELRKDSCRWKRTRYLVGTIVGWIGSFKKSNDEKVCVFIENYALSQNRGHRQSSSVSTLCELGGCLRMALYEKGYDFYVLSAMTIKKQFAGHGHASKTDMITAFTEKYGYPSMRTILQIPQNIVDQNPLEDMVDAIAILMTGIEKYQKNALAAPNTNITKKKRPKKTKKKGTDSFVF
jgi:Holliday junction resolvasome RuvABC endonuclease subunit